LQLTATLPSPPVNPGATVVIRACVTNTGDAVIKDVTLRFFLPELPSELPAPLIARLKPGDGVCSNIIYLMPMDVCSLQFGLQLVGEDACGNGVFATQFLTLPITAHPGLAFTMASCPATNPVPGSNLLSKICLTNTGNVTLSNVTLRVTFPAHVSPSPVIARLGAGEATCLDLVQIVGGNVCSAAYSVSAAGRAVCGSAVTAETNQVCAVTVMSAVSLEISCVPSNSGPGLNVMSKLCVVNRGNVAITNLVLTTTPPPKVPIPTIPRLEIGERKCAEIVHGAGSNLCSLGYTVTLAARDLCGNPVSAQTNYACPVITDPKLSLTATCPQASVAAGSPIHITLSVTNAGLIAITNIAIRGGVSSWQDALAQIERLLPGEGASLATTFMTPTNACQVHFSATARGIDLCGNTASDSTALKCALLSDIGIDVTAQVACQILNTQAIGQITCDETRFSKRALVARDAEVCYRIRLCNCGDVPLTNIVVIDDTFGDVTGVFFAGGNTSLAAGETRTRSFTLFANENITNHVMTTGSGAGLLTSGLDSVEIRSLPVSLSCNACAMHGLGFSSCPDQPLFPGIGTNEVGIVVTLCNDGSVDLTNVFADLDLVSVFPQSPPVQCPHLVIARLPVGTCVTNLVCVLPLTCPFSIHGSVLTMAEADAGTNGVCVYDRGSVISIFNLCPRGLDLGCVLPPPPITLTRGLPGSKLAGSGSTLGPVVAGSCWTFCCLSYWTQMSAREDGYASISTEGSADDTVLGVFAGPISSPNNLISIACNDDITSDNKQSRVQFFARSNLTYFVVVEGVLNVERFKITYGFDPKISSVVIRPDGSIELRSSIGPALAYALESCTSLSSPINWTRLFTTNLLYTQGYMNFVDTNALNLGQRFYRIVPGP
jgi:uncharacterized membrane protein